MTSKREIRAATLEEALAQAAKALGIHEDDVHYRLIDEGRKGVMGLGQRDVRIEIELHEPPPRKPEARGEPVPPTRVAEPNPERAAQLVKPGAPKATPAGDGDDRRGNLKQPPPRRTEGRGKRRGGDGRAEGGRRGESRRDGRRSRPRRGRRGAERRPSTPPAETGPPKDIPAEVLEHFRGEVQTLLDLMTLELQAGVEPTPSGVRVDLDGADLELVRGPDSEFEYALQFLLGRMSRRAFPEVGRIQVGREGGRHSERDEELIAEIREVAGQVQRTGMAKKLHPMNPYERRLVHLTVREFEGLETHSDGDGFLKTITVTRA